MADDLGYVQFQRTVLRLIGVDLASYRQGQMRRRLDALVRRVGAHGYGEYARMLERDPARPPGAPWAGSAALPADDGAVVGRPDDGAARARREHRAL